MKKAGGGERVVLFPSPYVGHLKPMLRLASLLHATGRISVTILHTTFNAPDEASYPDFHLVPIAADHIAGFQDPAEDHMAFLLALNAGCRDPFHREMERLLRRKHSAVVCMIADAHLYCTKEVAEVLRLRRIVLRTSGAATFRNFLSLPSRNLGDSTLGSDRLPVFPKSTPDCTSQFLSGLAAATTTSDAVVVNTFEALERSELRELESDLHLPVIPIGPLHKLISTSGRRDGESCEEWLDRHLPGSVLYVSFGSLACMDLHVLLEVAQGLVSSRQPFLWVLRPESVRGEASAVMVLSLVEEGSRGDGRVVQWAAQVEVLGHPSVGGFWTHCGWNSVLESVCEGVPMLCSPWFGDQAGNARLVTQVWEVGIEVEELERSWISTAIRRLLVEEEGREMRRKAMALKEDADACVREILDPLRFLQNRRGSSVAKKIQNPPP